MLSVNSRVVCTEGGGGLKEDIKMCGRYMGLIWTCPSKRSGANTRSISASCPWNGVNIMCKSGPARGNLSVVATDVQPSL